MVVLLCMLGNSNSLTYIFIKKKNSQSHMHTLTPRPLIFIFPFKQCCYALVNYPSFLDWIFNRSLMGVYCGHDNQDFLIGAQLSTYSASMVQCMHLLLPS